MAKKFDITQLFGVKPTQEGEKTAAEREKSPVLKIIPINIKDLNPFEYNFYQINNIEGLKNAIELFGIIEPLAVVPIEGGKYEIISGHRRYFACMELVKEGKTKFQYIPCGIHTNLDETTKRIFLIKANSETRELSDWEKMKQAEEMQKHLTVLKKRDNLPGRVRDLAAEALDMSVTQIARLNAISNNLTPEFTEEFKTGRIGLSTAYELSGLPEDKQQETFADYQEKGGLSLNDVKEKKQESAPPSEDIPQIPTPEPPPKSYPETPPDFEEGQEDGEDTPENKDFADMTLEEKAEAAVIFMNRNRFTIFKPGEDTRIFDFIVDALAKFAKMRDNNDI